MESAGRQIRLIDTPGLSWEVYRSAEDPNSVRARDILLRSKGRIDRLKDPTSVGMCLAIQHESETKECFSCEHCYSIPYGRSHAAL